MKTAIVTGASSGIGKETARELARRGMRVGIVCRNPKKADDTMAELRDSAPGASIDLFLGDLAELEQVRKLSAELHAAYPEGIDVLVNNAGVNLSQQQFTSEGFDAMLATTYLAPVLLTHLVGDLLLAAAPSRVIQVASEAHRFASTLDLDKLPDVGEYRGGLLANRAYGLTKLLLILYTQELARRLEGTRITANSLCPGLVATNLVGAQAMITRVGNVLKATPLIRTPRQGAEIAIRLASEASFEGVTGKFFSSTPGAGLVPPVRARGDAALQRAVYEKTGTWLDL
jgi:NAD(P)-dependent dehydrogenase (short-subunit alcohol dehydrogenase family)